VFGLIFYKSYDVSDDDEGIVRFVQFVLLRKHSPELLYFSEVTLYYFPSFAQFFFVFPRFITMALRWYYGTHTT